MSRTNLGLRYIICLALLCFTSQISFAQDNCECTNCPVPITDNGSFDGLLDVTVNGPNNLGLCPLQRVCFQINHTWVGDLSVTMTSPGGLSYILMGDLNNSTGGCGTDSDNIDVCIDVGTGNALTNNTEYACNGGNPCLIGNWTVACGGVTDPMSGAIQAPTCDLNDFNVMGAPANGTWELTINDVCAQDEGDLVNWSLEFACGTVACITCEPEGGALNQDDVQACFQSPDLNINTVPVYTGGNTMPDPADYGYTYAIVNMDNGIIFNFLNNTNLNALPPGNYQVCGLSFALADGAAYFPFIGGPYATLQADLASATPSFCGDLSDDCFEVQIDELPLPTFVEEQMCLGDCFLFPGNGQEYCSFGLFEIMLESEAGCDSLVNLLITPLEPSYGVLEDMVCSGQNYTFGGEEYAAGIHEVTAVASNGCDSVITLILLEFNVEAEISVNGDDSISCTNPSVELNSVFSYADGQAEWFDPSWNLLSTGDVFVTNAPACYNLVVSRDSAGFSCQDTSLYCVGEIIFDVEEPILDGTTVLCVGDTITYTSSELPEYTDYIWNLPPDVEILSGGDGNPYVELIWNSIFTGDICVLTSTDCGLSDPVCLAVDFEFTVGAPSLNGGDLACDGEELNYTAYVDGADSYVWTVTGGVILDGQNTANALIQWGAAGGTVCVNAVTYCGTSPATCLDVAPNYPPVMPEIVGLDTLCADGIYSFSVVQDTNALEWIWDVDSTMTISSGQGTSNVEISIPLSSAGGTICVTPSNICGNGPQECFDVFAIQEPNVEFPAGPASVCPGTASFSVPAVDGAIDYVWTSNGGTVSAGQGTSMVDFDFNTPGDYEVCLSVETACFLMDPICSNIEILELVGVPVISGDDIVCPDGTGLYEVNAVANANSYIWTSSCGSISSGQGSNSIDLDWLGCPTGGEVCVAAVGTCDTSAVICMDVTLVPTPVAPSLVLPATACALDTILLSANTSDSNIVDFDWQLPACASLLSGAGTENIQVVFDASCSIVDICLSTSNGCEYGPQECQQLEVLSPPVVGSISGENLLCIADEEVYQIPSVDNVNLYTWTVSGGQITSGQGSNTITVQWNNNGNQSICLLLSGVCSDIVVPCYDVFVQANMLDPEIIGDAVICDSITTTYSLLSPIPEAVQYTWTTSCGTIETGQGTEQIDINWTGCPNGGQVCVTANGPCDDSAEICFDVTGTTNPEPVFINGNANACIADEMIYCGTSVNADQFNWTVVGGSIVSGDGTDCINVVWESEGSAQVCLQTSNSCGETALECFSVLVDDKPVAPQVAGASLSCIDEQQLFSMLTADDDISSIEWSIPSGCGIISSGQGTDEVNVDWVNAGNCEVCVRIANECGFSDLSCAEVEIIAIPAPQAMADNSTCGLSFDLSAVVGSGTVLWTSNGPGSAVFTAEDQANTMVDVSDYGSYIFTVEVDDNGCVGTDELIIDFYESPMLAVSPVESCDATGDNYTITFEISNGTAPYNVVGLSGTWTGNSFTSEPISSSSAYALEVYDSNNCGPVVIEGSFACPCTSDAGVLTPVDLVLCAGETEALPVASNMIMDGNDTYTFFVTDVEPTASYINPASIIYNNLNGLISFEPGMNYGQTYYMVLAVGDQLNGIVDINDLCLSVTAASTFTFRELPVANFASSSAAICEGDIATVSFNVEAQNCVDLIIEDNNSNQYILNCVTDGATFDLPASSGGVYTYEIISIQEDGLCFGLSGSDFELTVNTTPVLEIESNASVCNSTDTGSSTSIDLSDYIIQGGAGLVWTNLDGCAFSGTLPAIDLTGVTPGDYQFACQTSSAIAPCMDPIVYITLTVEDCVCPDLSVDIPDAFCNSSASFDLDDYLLDPTVNVNWTFGAIPAQGDFDAPVLNGNVVNLGGSAPGVYEFVLDFAGTAPAGCVLSNSIDFQLADQLVPGLASETLRICYGENEVVDLSNLINNEDDGGVWSEESVNTSSGGAFSAGLGQFSILNQAAGIYTFSYEVDSDDPCLDLSTEVNVQIDALPSAIVEEFDTITCVNLEVQLTAYEEDNYAFEWTNQSNLLEVLGTSSGIMVDSAGIYQLQVVDEESGCADQAVVDVQAYLEVPIPDLVSNDVGCFGETNGSIIIQDITGGTAPYLVSFDDGAYSDDFEYVNLSPGMYNVAVEDAYGCVSNAAVEVKEPDPLELDIDVDYSALENEFVGIGDSVEIFGYLNTPLDDIDQIQWSPSGLVDCDTCLSVVAFPTETTTLSVRINVGSCSIREFVQVLVKKEYPVFVPNAVSFNNDGVNDVLYVFGGEEVAKINYMRIFDRWGGEVFVNESFLPNNPEEGWTGQFNGKQVNSGTFVYVMEVEFIDGRVEVYKGDISVLN